MADRYTEERNKQEEEKKAELEKIGEKAKELTIDDVDYPTILTGPEIKEMSELRPLRKEDDTPVVEDEENDRQFLGRSIDHWQALDMVPEDDD